MTRRPSRPAPKETLLGIEGGGTRTSVLLVEADGAELALFSAGPCNVRMTSDDRLIEHLRAIAERLPVSARDVSLAAIGLAGARTAADQDRIRRAAARVFPGVPVVCTNDLATALATARPAHGSHAQVLILSGTGSCSFARSADGRTARVGGRGHIIGDRGSAWDIAQRALRELVAYFDHRGRWPKLGAFILETLALNDPEDLIPWSMQADKREIASLAIPTFAAARNGDRLARRIVEDAAASLAADGDSCAAKLLDRDQRVQFIFNGSVLTKNPAFVRSVRRRLRQSWPRATFTTLTRPSVWGAIEIARQAMVHSENVARWTGEVRPPKSRILALTGQSPADSPTEQRNPRSKKLDTMPLDDAVDLMLDEERGVPAALREARADIVWVLRRIIRAFRSGGRLFYVGAGTSGRLGVLDASECPPTFRAPREQVQGIIAGGRQALWSAVEGAEDDPVAGAEAIRFRNIGARDVVIGIAASGRTPFVWGALAEARRHRAATVLVAFNPSVRAALDELPHKPFSRIVCVSVGPEVLTGSTRLKAGTATKLLLNIFSTLSMARSGKIISNLMIDLNPSNRKLRDRAVRILVELTGCDATTARDALDRSGWVVKEAWQRLQRRRSRRIKS